MPPNPADFGHPEVSPGATAPRACSLRVGIPAKWPRADVPGSRRNGARFTGQQRAHHGCGDLRAARHPIRPRRLRRRTTGRREPERVAGERAARNALPDSLIAELRSPVSAAKCPEYSHFISSFLPQFGQASFTISTHVRIRSRSLAIAGQENHGQVR